MVFYYSSLNKDTHTHKQTNIINKKPQSYDSKYTGFCIYNMALIAVQCLGLKNYIL